MRKKLVLVSSEKMDGNRKESRNENGLIRMSATTRDYMGFHDDRVELWPVGSSGEDRLNKSIMLKIFHAYSEDIKKVKKDIERGEMSKEELKRVGFVTTKIFNRICGDNKAVSSNIWISDDVHDTVMGVDPEFLLFRPDENVVVSANDVLPHNGEIGSDGAMAEIRPKPEITTKKLVENMAKIFKDNIDNGNIRDYRWIATCFHRDDRRGYPVGGHIHVGSPMQIAVRSDAVKGNFYHVANKIIDEYITVPLIKLDGPDGAGRRSPEAMFSGFGGFGDFRTDHGRLEHRSASGIWLLHPAVARAVLGTAKAVIDEIFKLIADNEFDAEYILPRGIGKQNLYYADFDGWKNIPLAKDMNCVESSGWMKNTMAKSDKDVINATFVKNLHTKLKELSTYKEGAQYIDGLCEILKLKYSEISKLERDIRKTWTNKKKFIVDV